MPHALLLSPDDQAVSAITGVLEEMSVTCERPLDGVSAAHKLNSQSFDLVLVDCENLPAAKLIFDVCRRGKNGNNPVPIAIVDGRAGLPTAFRLGAELILTKPVAKDQARTTIRTAVGRVRKDIPASETVSAQTASAPISNPVATSAVMTATTTAAITEERGRAAAVSSQLTSFDEPTPSFVSSPVPAVAVATTASAPVRAGASMTHSAVEVIEAPDEASKPNAIPARPFKPSDDPVMAELEELELAAAQPESSELSSEFSKATPVQPATESAAPLFSLPPQEKPKPRGSLVALLVVVLLAAGFYAAWMYQPGFRDIAQPQIDRVLALAGIANPKQNSAQTPNPVKPAAQPAPAAISANTPESSTGANQAQSAAPDSATNSTTNLTASASATVSATATPGTPVAPPVSVVSTAAAPVVTKPEANKPGDNKNDAKKDAAAVAASTAPLAGESTAIILSSKGAEKRLAHNVTPKYPAEARSGQAEGTVVLKEVVDENGQVAGVRLVEGDATLATAAIQAVKQWRYRPYVRDGKTLPFQTVVIVDF
jgi:TonB family protein